MKNADKPAMPLTEDMDAAISSSKDRDQYYTGLTKREHFAGLAMQGFSGLEEDHFVTVQEMAVTAVKYADALLDALEKSKGREEAEVKSTIASSTKG